MINLTEKTTRKELLEIAKELGITGVSRKKRDEIYAIVESRLSQQNLEIVAEPQEEIEVAEAVEVVEVDEEVEQTEQIIDNSSALVHLPRKELVLRKYAETQAKLTATDNGVIEIQPVEVKEEKTAPTINQSINTIYEKHYNGDATQKRGRKGGDLYVAPAKELKPVKEDSKVHRFIQKMTYGATIEDLCEITPNPKSVRVYFSYDLKLKGYGVKQIGDKFHLILPDGILQPLIISKKPSAVVA